MGTWTVTTRTTMPIIISQLSGMTTSTLPSLQLLIQINLLSPLPLPDQGTLHPSQLCTYPVRLLRKHLIADNSPICKCLSRGPNHLSRCPSFLLLCFLRPLDLVPVLDQAEEAPKCLCLLHPLVAPRFPHSDNAHRLPRQSQVLPTPSRLP